MEIAAEIVDLANSVETNNNNILRSGLLPRADNLTNKAEEGSESLKMCNNSSLQFINHYLSIKPNQHTTRSKLYRNRNGKVDFLKEF